MDYSRARLNMVEGQIRTNRVTDQRLLDGMSEVPRERFVPPHLQSLAYTDEDLDIGAGRFLCEPMVLARMVESAAVTRSDTVLVVGCATGYSCAVIARLAGMVIGIEEHAQMVEAAGAALTDLQVDNAAVVQKTLTHGYPQQGPYHAILLEGAVTAVPENILGQLEEGGRLITVIRPDPRATGVATLFLRRGSVFAKRALFDANIPYLPGFMPVPQFVF